MKKMLNECIHEQSALQRKIAIREGEIEQQRHERHHILESCKVRMSYSVDNVTITLTHTSHACQLLHK